MDISYAQNMVDPLTGNVTCLRAEINGQVCLVPIDPANRHYAEIMRQVEAGTLAIQEATA